MANSLELKTLLADYTAGLNHSFPLRQLTNWDMQSKFSDGFGDTIYAKGFDYGTTYQTSDLTGKFSNVNRQGVPLEILPYRKGIALSVLENTLEMDGDTDEIIKRMSQEMAYSLTNVAYNTAIRGAAQGIVTTGTFADLSNVGIRVKNSKMNGKLGGMLSFDLHGTIAKSGIQSFGNSSLAKDMYDGVIGSFAGVDYVEGNTPYLETGAIFPAGAVTITNSTNKFGTTDAKYTPTSAISPAVTVKAGTAFTAAGIYAVDELGNKLPYLRVFTVQADVELSGSTAIAIDVGDVIFSGPFKNVSGAISAVAITNIHEASSTYATGVVLPQPAVMMAAQGIKPLKTLESANVPASEGFPIRAFWDSNGTTNIDNLVFDVMFGASIYKQVGITALWMKV